MTTPRDRSRVGRRLGTPRAASLSIAAAAATALAMLAASAMAAPPAKPSPPAAASVVPTIRIGDSDLAQRHRSSGVVKGVAHTRVVIGDKAANAKQINATTRGPWQVNVVMINPERAPLQLRAVYGTTLMAPDTVANIALWSGARVAMNASYFNSGGPKGFKGDPIGLTVVAGTVMSEPTGSTAEQNVLIDSRTGRLTMGRFTWRGYVINRQTAVGRTLAGVNRLPRVPAECLPAPQPSPAKTPKPAPGTTQPPVDQKACDKAAGELVRFTPRFSTVTPAGPGAEAVYGRDGCLVRVAPVRGTKLTASQFSVQGTGHRAAMLLREAKTGCVKLEETVRDDTGRAIALTSSSYVVTGRYRLVRDGKVVTHSGTSGVLGRNPRSIIGHTEDGRVALVTVDGRSVHSVGATMTEAARVADSLGLVDAVNLDGGGSTTLVVDRKVVNRVSGAAARQVSDAIVLM